MLRNIYSRQVMLFEKPICIQVSEVDEGMLVQIAGGDKSHIGAVAVIDPQGEEHFTEFTGHRDLVIAGKWAQDFYEIRKVPIVVSVGVHYDRITKEEIQVVVEAMDLIRKELLNQLSTW